MRGRGNKSSRGNFNSNKNNNFNNDAGNNTSNRGTLNRGRGRTFRNRSRYPTQGQQRRGGGGQRGQQFFPKANLTGMSDIDVIDKQTINFIADSGATDHMVRKGIILTNFKKSSEGVIKSANKNSSADIKIDGRGDLTVISKFDGEKILKLSKIISAKDMSDNLISLRRFADMGMGIYLDDNVLKIFDRETLEIYLSGVYEKPNWIISLNAINTSDRENLNYEKYTCKARIGIIEELLS